MKLRIINGSRVAQESYSGSTVNQNSEFSIGRRHDTNGVYYHVKIDEVAYWNTELDADAISALYNSGTPLSASSNSGNYDNSNDLVMYYKFEENLNDSMEADKILNLISQNTSSGEYDFSDFVILYRTNAQSRIIEDKLRRQGIPYHIIGGVKFYERKEIKDK